MNDKTIRYIAVLVGSLFILALLLINDGSYFRDRHRYWHKAHGLFASSIKYTVAYDILKNIVRTFGASYSTSRETAYLLWYLCLGSGVLLSWKCRFYTGKKLSSIIKSIHKKV